MPRPPFSIWSVQPRPIQCPTCIRLECIHYPLGRPVRIDNDVHVVASYVRCHQHPSPRSANLLDCFENRFPPGAVQTVRCIFCQIHRMPFATFASLWISTPVLVVLAIDRTSHTRHPRAIANKCDEVRAGGPFHVKYSVRLAGFLSANSTPRAQHGTASVSESAICPASKWPLAHARGSVRRPSPAPDPLVRLLLPS